MPSYQMNLLSARGIEFCISEPYTFPNTKWDQEKLLHLSKPTSDHRTPTHRQLKPQPPRRVGFVVLPLPMSTNSSFWASCVAPSPSNGSGSGAGRLGRAALTRRWCTKILPLPAGRGLDVDWGNESRNNMSSAPTRRRTRR